MSELRSDLIPLCREAIHKAGNIAQSLKNKIKISYKSQNQPVTNADIEINKYLFDFFKKETPKFGWLSEESTDDLSRLNNDFFWCLDPIDGTRSFISGKPEYTISIALMNHSFPILGMIFNPETKEFFYAEKNKGAFCNSKKILVKSNKNLNSSVYAISTSEIKYLRSKDFFNKKKIIKLGSIAYKIALVAKGEIDVALSLTKKNDWDIAAADVLITEAGGELVEMNGKKITYNTKNLNIKSVLASNVDNIYELKNRLNY